MVMLMVLGRGFYLRRCLPLLILWYDRLCCDLISLEIIILSLFLVVISWQLILVIFLNTVLMNILVL
jgi:hypothetical protein